jgi:hypothetical protein
MLEARISLPLRITRSDKIQKVTKFWTPLNDYLTLWKQQGVRNEEGRVGTSQAPPLPAELNSHPHAEALQEAAGMTVFPWMAGRTNGKSFRNMVTTCLLETVSDIELRTKWLGNFSILVLRKNLESLFERKIMVGWKYWDGIEIEDVTMDDHKSVITGKSLIEEVMLMNVDGDLPLEEQEGQKQLMVKDKETILADSLFSLAKQKTATAAAVKASWALYMRPGVGTINVGTEESPRWALLPDIAFHLEQILAVSKQRSSPLFHLVDPFFYPKVIVKKERWETLRLTEPTVAAHRYDGSATMRTEMLAEIRRDAKVVEATDDHIKTRFGPQTPEALHEPPTFKGNSRVLLDLIEQRREGGQKKILRLKETAAGRVWRRKDTRAKGKGKAKASGNTAEEDKAIERFDGDSTTIHLLCRASD